MPKIEIVPFKSWHVGMMNLREWDKKFLASAPDLGDISSNYFQRNSYSFTGISPEGIIGAGGLARIFKTNYEAWVYTTPLFEKYGLQVALIARRLLNDFFKNTKVLRVQAPIDSNHLDARRFAEVMGLYREATLRRYGPEGQDFYMYARCK